MASTSLKFYELIDLAVGVPNASNINVNVLHAVLQMIATQIGLNNHKIDFEGEDAKQIKDLKEQHPTNIMNLKNYIVSEKDTKSSAARNIQLEAKSPVKMVEFHRLENKVRMLATHVEAITMLPATDEIIEKMRAHPETTPISEMVHNVALTKRVSALEEGTDKFASILERVYKDQNRIRVAFHRQFPDVIIDSSDIEVPTGKTDSIAATPGGSTSSKNIVAAPTALQVEELGPSPEFYEALENLTVKVNNLEIAFEKRKDQSLELKKHEPEEDVKHSLSAPDYTGGSVEGGGTARKLFLLEKVAQSNELKLKHFEQETKDDLQSLKEQVKQVETEFNRWVDKLTENFGEDFLTSGKRSSAFNSGGRDSMIMNEVTGTIGTIQQEISEMASNLQSLVLDQEKKSDTLRKLKTSIDKMEVTKLDKDLLDETIASKADTILVNRKVSYEQFDFQCNEFNSTLTNTLRRLNEQEKQWSAALGEVHNAIKNKLDRNEISPIKDFINYRLKILQDKLKAVLAEKLESEGAGTKKQLMKEHRCISCDKSVMLKTDRSTYRGVNEFPVSKSVKPYLTYELDQIRQQEKSLPLSRNLNEFNKVLKEATRKGKSESEKIDHLCNRYCGGRHTQTTATQRVAKTGHFSEQWGLEVLPYVEKTENPPSPDPANLPLPPEQEEKKVSLETPKS